MPPIKYNTSNNPELLATIKEEYIYGTIAEDGTTTNKTYKELSEKHSFSLDSIKKAGRKEGWPALREDYCTKTALKISEKKSSVTAAEIVQSDDKTKSTANKIRRKVDEQLDNNPKLRSSDLLNLSLALANSQKIEKIAQGEILERAKLEVEDKSPVVKDNVFTRVDNLLMFVDKGNDSNDDRQLQSKDPINS